MTQGARHGKFLPGALFTLLVTGLSSAQEPLDLQVEHLDSALSCPEVGWFRERVGAHLRRSGQAGKFRVTLERSEEIWRARIQSFEPGREELPAAERLLEDRGATCDPLAEAVAVTIAILAEARRQPDVPPVAKPEPEKPSPIAGARTAPEPSPGPAFRIWMGAGGGATAAWIAPVAPAFGLGVALDSKHFRQAVRVMLTTEQNFDLYPGRVVVQAWLLSMASCLRLTRGDTGVALCGIFDAGMLNGRAEGFAGGVQSTQGYEAVGLELQPTAELAERVRLSAALSALVPFTRESFSVTGLGPAYVPPSLNGRALLFLEVGAF